MGAAMERQTLYKALNFFPVNANTLNVPVHALFQDALIFLRSNTDLQSLTPDCSAVVRIRRKHRVCVIGTTSEVFRVAF
jgi:hypothetical protein